MISFSSPVPQPPWAIHKNPAIFFSISSITYRQICRPPHAPSRENGPIMTSRQARRAAERAARKLEKKNAALDAPAHETPETTPTVISPARLEANRANSQLSTGPKSEQGKATSSKNALKTALTGRTVLLPTDDAERYEAHLAEYDKIYKPVGELELEIVQKLADTWWRLDRIPGLEEALYVKGCNEFADQVVELDPRARLTMLRMHTYVAYERQFRNLQLQEQRLFRLLDKLKAELKALQKEREEAEHDALARAAMLYTAAKKDGKRFNPEDHGFEFSTADIEAFLHGRRARQLTEQAASNG